MKDILYTVGRTVEGEMVKASDANKQTDYHCPTCEKVFVLKQGTRKRAHFAHKTLTPNCTPESALHYGFKLLLAKKIQQSIDQKTPLDFRWECSFCGVLHTGNLVKKANSVQVEHNLGVCRPDLALLDVNGSPVAVIEVVVTHPPEEAALDYYAANSIPVVIFTLKSDKDLDRLEHQFLTADSVSICISPKCSKCGQPKQQKRLLIVKSSCWKCGEGMNVLSLETSFFYSLPLEDLSEDEIKIAAQNGVFLKKQYSRTTNSRYIANTCRKCNAFIGHHHLFVDHISNHEPIVIRAGYYCPCNEDDN